MTRIFILFLLPLILANCSLNENSKIWNKNKKLNIDKNTKIIFAEKKISYNELNPNISLNLSQIKIQNKILDDKNNFGVQKYSGEIKKIKNFRFSKFNNEIETDLKPLFLRDGIVFFDSKGSVIRFDNDQKIVWKKNAINYELKIEDDYRKSKENQKQRFFFPLNQETNFKINKFFRILTKEKKNSPMNLNIKGRDFTIQNFYEGICRFSFDELCNRNLGAEDYLEIVKNSKFIVIEEIPLFSNNNSDQQQRFITLLDIIHDKDIPLATTAAQSLENFTSSKSLKAPFERTISRLYDLTSREYNL